VIETEENENSTFFKPQLSKGSVKILEKKKGDNNNLEATNTSQAVHQRLYNTKQSQIANQAKTVFASKDGTDSAEAKKEFVPQINKKSKNIKREGKVEEFLVSDAKRRQEMKKQSLQ
jgi:hypothetical protein